MCSVKGHPSACCCPADKQKKFDPTKPVQTRDGRKARIICTDRKSPTTSCPIVALVDNFAGGEMNLPYSPEGRYLNNKYEGGFDLVNIPERREEFANIYSKNISVGRRATREEADSVARELVKSGEKRMGVLKLIYEDDELVGVELVE